MVAYNDYAALTTNGITIVNVDQKKLTRYLFSMDEIIYKYGPLASFELCEIYQEKNYAPEKDYFIFAENTHSDIYYLANNNYSEIFCTDYDGNFLWHCASSSDMFVSLLTIFLSMQSKGIKSGKDNLSENEYLAFYLKCKELSDDFEANDEFLRFMCCVVD